MAFSVLLATMEEEEDGVGAAESACLSCDTISHFFSVEKPNMTDRAEVS